MNFCQFKPIFSIYIFLLFIVFTIVGTLSHEYGHILVAKWLGYETTLDYGSMSYYPKGFKEDAMVLKRIELIKPYNDKPFEEWPEELKQEVKLLSEKIDEKYEWSNSVLVTLGGPTQTLLTSFLGLLILGYRKSRYKTDFSFLDWLGIFFGLFVLREIFNTILGLIEVLFYGQRDFAGDEFGISRFLGFNQWVIPVITMLFGLAVVLYIIFRVLHIKYRFSFIVAGFLGGLAGFGIWFGFLGRMLFPLG